MWPEKNPRGELKKTKTNNKTKQKKNNNIQTEYYSSKIIWLDLMDSQIISRDFNGELIWFTLN